MAQIECRDVCLGYHGVTVCENLSFSVHAGDYLCVVGNNGSGKSTLMKALLHLKTPDSGEILFGDGVSPHEVGYLPQQNDSREDFPASVREVVLSGCVGTKGFRFFPDRSARRLAEENMKRLGIDTLSNRSFGSLSGGQRQRALLARALSANGKILLLDEPVSGLDPKGIDEFYETVAHLNGDGVTVIMITHDLSAVARYATSVLCMSETPTFFPSAKDYLSDPSHENGKEERHV